MSLSDQMELQRLRSELAAAKNLVSRAINTLERVKILLDEGDIDEAVEVIREATE